MINCRLLPKPNVDGRIDDDRYFRVNSAMLVFAHKISVYLDLSEENYITFYKSGDGFLCFSLGTEAKADSYHINRVNGGTKRPYHTCFIRNAIIAYGIQKGGPFYIVHSSWERKHYGDVEIFKTTCPVR